MCIWHSSWNTDNKAEDYLYRQYRRVEPSTILYKQYSCARWSNTSCFRLPAIQITVYMPSTTHNGGGGILTVPLLTSWSWGSLVLRCQSQLQCLSCQPPWRQSFRVCSVVRRKHPWLPLAVHVSCAISCLSWVIPITFTMILQQAY